jgi:subfamily B ATP-binding cassette protein MsbA
MVRRLWAYLRPHRARLFTGILFGVLAAQGPLAIAHLLGRFFHTLTHPGPNSRQALLLVCFGVVVAYAVIGVLRYLQSTWLAEVAQRVGMTMRRDVYAHIQRLSLAYFHSRRTGALMSTLTSDISRLQDSAMRVRDLVAMPVQVVALLVTMFFLNWKLSAFALLVVPMMALAIQRLTRRLRSISRDSQQRTADVTAVMEEALSAPRVIRAFSAEEREVKRFERVSMEAVKLQLRAARRSARLGPVVDLIGAVGMAATLWVGGSQILSGRETVEDLLQFAFLVSTLANSISSVGSLRGSWEEMMGAADRLFREVLDVTPDIRNAPDAVTLPSVEGRIRFEHVHFAYEPDNPVLQDVDFGIEPGQVVALVGETGAGKSTLADLVPRFYDPTHGAVLIDGHDIRNVTVESLRRHIGIVPQDTVLFSGTIRENIAYGRPDATDAEVEAAARAANADSFIEAHPLRYEMPVGERGTTLSGGQKQRVAIARALLADPRILILDEATSALDASTEALVQEALDTLMRGRTTIVIAHRLSTIVSADRIVVLRRGGRVAEMGTHAELLARGGVYASLYESQRRAADLSASVVAEP